jgi:FkbM family methyltransferase
MKLKHVACISYEGLKVKRNLAYESEMVRSGALSRSDQYVSCYNEIYEDSEAYVDESFHNFKVEPGDVVVDLGANIGLFSNKASEDGASIIHAFEPHHLAYSCLIDNKPENCYVHNLGISDRMGLGEIFTPEWTGNTVGSGMHFPDFHTGRKIASSNRFMTIDLNSIFTIFNLENVDYLKMDIEGSEKLAFDGISDDNLLKIKKIALEYHGDLLPVDFKENLIERTTKLGFDTKVIELGGMMAYIKFYRR